MLFAHVFGRSTGEPKKGGKEPKITREDFAWQTASRAYGCATPGEHANVKTSTLASGRLRENQQRDWCA
jgi:hypothetical protein